MSDRPLWELLLEFKTAVSPQRPLTCEECFAILEYLAEAFEQETAAARQTQLHHVIKQHLAVCPNCQTLYQTRLAEMEQAYRLLNKP
jgi:predicted anti-sigma-YlaC factor YlaD